ncbi:hypothetical protein, partial [Serratia fonticola]|uniref:hypothetical protein n=1 Tax=Serratia fonticola TaxID=47917 RepID=UPI003BB51739
LADLAQQPDQRAITLRRKPLQLISASLLHYFNHTTRVHRSLTVQLRKGYFCIYLYKKQYI